MNVTDYVQGIGLPMERIGENFGLKECPLCKHCDCFRFKQEFFQCFSCKASGDAFKLEALLKGISYQEAKARLTGNIVELPNPLLDLVNRNHEALMGSLHVKWLTDERRISTDVLRRFRVGCFQSQDGRTIYTFPYMNGGLVGNIKSRTANKKLMFFKKGCQEFLYNRNALRGAREVVVVEGELDCLAAYTYGLRIPCVSVGLGAGNIKPSWRDDFKEVETVFIAFDTDDAGQAGARKLASFLGRDRCRLVRLPHKDLNDCLKLDVDKATIEAYIGQALLLDQIEILEALESIPEGETMLGARIEPVLEMIAARPDTETEDYLGRIKERFPNTPYKQLLDFRARVKSLRRDGVYQQPEEELPPTPVIPEDIKTKALDLLKGPGLLQTVGDWLTELGLVGEEANKVPLWLFTLSRKLDKPIHATIYGQSSSGKSELMKTVLKTVPEEDVLEFSSMSARALDYRDGDLIGKVISIAELDGIQSEELEYSIRTAQSEGKLVRSFAIRDDSTGDMKVIEKAIQVRSVFLMTTTRTSIHNENATRCFSLYADESTAQTQRVIEFIRRSQSREFKLGDARRKELTEVLKAAQRLLESIEIVIPYAGLLRFPETTTRNRRDSVRFMSFLKVIAFLRQYQKERKKDDLGEFIEADLEDYELAFRYIMPILGNTLSDVTPRAMAVLESCCAVQAGKNLESMDPEARVFTVKDVQFCATKRGIDLKNAVNLRQQLLALTESEHLELVSGNFGQRGSRQSFRVACDFDCEEDGRVTNIRTNSLGVLTPDELRDVWAVEKV